MFPSDPLQAPLWAVLASLTHARRILEVGCGHGYTAAVMASAAGPDCRVDTIEEDPDHANLAEQSFERRGLSARIRVLRGRGQNVLPRLKGRYDIVFLDGDWREYPGYIPHLRRLTHPGSIVVTANLNPLFGGWEEGCPESQQYNPTLHALSEIRTSAHMWFPGNGTQSVSACRVRSITCRVDNSNWVIRLKPD